MNRTIALFSLLLLSPIFALAQDKPVDSGKLVKEGIEKYDAEEYEKALALFAQVPDYDSNGTWAQYEKAMALHALERYSESVDVLHRLVGEFKYRTPATYNLWGTAADDMGQTEKALKIYQDGLRLYPMSHLIAFNAGVTFLQNEHTDSGYAYAFRAANINPMHPGSYNTLGMANVKKGCVVPAMLNLIHAVLVGLESNNGIRPLQNLNALCTGGSDAELKKAKNPYAGFPVDFKNEDFLITSRSALTDKFKKKIKLREPVALQTLLLMDLLQEEHEKIPFYGPLHVAFLRKVKAAELEETLVYTLYVPTGHATIMDYTNKNSKKLRQLLELYFSHISEWRKRKDLTAYGLPGEYELTYHKNNGAVESATSTVETAGKGYAIYLYSDEGRHTFTGYSKDAKLENEARYYHTEGYVEETRQYSAGKPVGETRLFYADGTLKGTIRMPKNETTDTLYMDFYYEDGSTPEFRYKKVNGKFEGVNRLYFPDGSLKLEVAYSNDLWNGKRSEYYETGGLQSIEHYKTGERDGAFTYYYANGQKSAEGTYTNGKIVGEWKKYHYNGKPMSVQRYDDKTGNLTKSESWDDLGNLDEVQELDGNASGTVKLYGKGGKVHSEFTFAGKKVKSCKTYDAQGNVTHNATPTGKKFQFYKNDYYYKLTETGLIENEERVGTFVEYHNGKDTASLTSYKKGEVDGENKIFDVTGTLKEVHTYKNGIQDGFFAEYYRDGSVSYSGHYVNNSPEGYWKYYKDNGKLGEIRFFTEGKKHGKFENFDSYGNLTQTEFYDNEEKTKEVRYEKGVAVDTLDFTLGKTEVVNRYPNQKTKETYTVRNGVLHGDYRFYYPNGKVMVENTYVNDYAHGMYKSYYADGKPYAEIPKVYGRNFGRAVYYHENGKVERETEYVNGNKHGKQTVYYASGKKYRETDFRNDKMDGTSSYFAPDGKLIVTLYYEWDYLVGYSYADASGKAVAMIPVEGGTGKVVAYYPDGSKSCEFGFKKSSFDGRQVAYFPGTESPIFIENWANFALDGEQTYYDFGANHKSLQYTAQKGLREGVYREYHPNGKIRYETEYEHDDIKQSERWFTESGAPALHFTYVNGILSDVGK